MINTLAQIDYVASAGTSPWHRASALGKVLLAFALVGVAIWTPSVWVLGLLLLTVLVLCFSARIPASLVLVAATTPLLFSVIFMLAHVRGEWDESLVLLLRPMLASLSAVWLVGTTPYPDLFAPISRVLPRRVGDSLFLTYRAVFALLARVERLWKALVLRGAMARPAAARFTMAGEAVGTVVLSGFDRSERLYRAMLMRGHSGRICGCRHYLDFTRDDFWIVVAFVWTAAISIVLWKVGQLR